MTNNVDACILCGICMKRCPCDAITVDKPARMWSINRFRCVQCGTCVRECPKQCLAMEPTYTPPATEKRSDVFEVPEHAKAAAAQAEKSAKDAWARRRARALLLD